jgi:hypothetical protein
LEIEHAIAGGDNQILKTHLGVHIMRANAKASHLRDAHMLETEGHPDQVGIITCYGEGWHRDRVDWEKTPLELIGSQMLSSTPINFATQIGFYALGWGPGSEVEFIGFSGEQTIGDCLLEHTWDRVSGRWTHFSFYGLRPIFLDGSFGPLPENVSRAEAAASMLSILLDVVQPKVNPRYYDLFSTLEFAQR